MLLPGRLIEQPKGHGCRTAHIVRRDFLTDGVPTAVGGDRVFKWGFVSRWSIAPAQVPLSEWLRQSNCCWKESKVVGACFARTRHEAGNEGSNGNDLWLLLQLNAIKRVTVSASHGNDDLQGLVLRRRGQPPVHLAYDDRSPGGGGRRLGLLTPDPSATRRKDEHSQWREREWLAIEGLPD